MDDEKESTCVTHNEKTQDLWGNGVYICELCFLEATEEAYE